MEDEIEDIVGEVKLTDSQKSVAASNVYSMDFTDSSSDKNNSSGMDTYVIDLYDSEESDSYPIHEDRTVINLKHNKKNKDPEVKSPASNKLSPRPASATINCSIVAQEIFTQTSKTIFELAQAESNKQTLETQTSFISITESRTIQYRIDMPNRTKHVENCYKTILTNALEDESSKFQASDSDTIKSDKNSSEVSSEDRIIDIFDADSKENALSEQHHEAQYENTSDFEDSIQSDASIEQDSLMEPKNPVETRSDTSEVAKVIDSDIEDLYKKLEQHAMNRLTHENRHRTLTPLTEESTVKRDDTPSDNRQLETSAGDSDRDVLFTNFAGGRVKMLPQEDCSEKLKLPPIQNRPNSPHLNFLFTVHPCNKLNKPGTLPCLYESERVLDRWELDTKDLASGESPLISGRSELMRNDHSIHLPPIHIEGYVVNSKISKSAPPVTTDHSPAPPEPQQAAISIKEKIKELKMNPKTKPRVQSRFKESCESRSCSPSSGGSQESKHGGDAAERGCDALCVDLIRRMRSASWYEVSDTLEEIPKALDKFWPIIAENRIADLIRQVSGQVESPRTQIARVACSTLAHILKSTNYTKKPDFNEAVTLLLTKTGSFSRPVRRAANVALDSVVCGVEFSHAVTALCIHGVDHKSPLVRCAAARLLVVSCALAGGGRELLRARPATAAAARRHALRSLAILLDDKNTDARKYAERLYSMLRPLGNFEAYYLTDVDVELASRQMKKYDRLLFSRKNDAR